MPTTRRETLGMGLTAAAGFGLSTVIPFRALAETGRSHSHATDGGQITIHPVDHASFVMETPGPVIWNDPVGGAARYADLPRPDLILVTHRHGDHYNAETLEAVAAEGVTIVTNRDVFAMMPDGLKARTRTLEHGDRIEIAGITIAAMPAYNITEERLKYHPKDRGDNGYILGIDGRTVYIAGDTEDIPEMRALNGIDIAFVPMNLPYTMPPEQAAGGVAAFAPKVVYPYHYRDQDPGVFASRLKDAGAATEVVMGDWYPATAS